MPLTYSLDFTRLAAAYASGALTPSRVVSDVLAAACATDANPVWLHIEPRAALMARAGDLEQRRTRGERLPLHGLPFAVKDNVDVKGRPTTAACPRFSYTAAESAHVVGRLEAAGAIFIGKTNLDQFATGLVGTRSPYGACTNPFDARYISGGSSSGSAVAVALGQVSFALGTDTAGSGRVPAGFCNIVGLKPTRGLISTHGVVPACRSLDCVSIFALTAEDALAVLDVARGHDADDPYSRNDPEPDAMQHGRGSDSSIRRVGMPRADQREFFGDACAEAAFDTAVEHLAALGAEMVEIDFAPFLETARLLYEGPWLAERLAAIEPFFFANRDALLPVTREIIGAGARYSAIEAFTAQYALETLKKRCALEWKRMDVLAVPTAGTIYTLEQVAADPLRSNSNLGYYTNFVNLLDLCALAVPAGFRRDGLPAGVTLIAPALRDEAVARFAARLHRETGKTLGATRFELPEDAERVPHAAQRLAGGAVDLAVVGAHLSGLPLNHQLTSRGARLVGSCTTAPDYRLYALPGTTPPKPGLARVPQGRGSAIDAEVWSVPLDAFGSFVAEIPPPLAIGTVTLADGRNVKGFLCESYALHAARDISSYGGWRNFILQS